jgi:hypothetical protein
MPISNHIPDSRRAAVRLAIQSAFGSHEPRDFQPISGGVSGALILRFDLQGRSYVLRLEPERIALHDRERGFACMSAAAVGGASPRVHYADPVGGVAIMDFIAGRPLATYPGGAAALAKALGGLIAKVQATAPFPSLGDYPDAISNLLAGLRSSPLLPPGELEPHADGLALIRAAVRWDCRTLVSSHNDPNPRNLIFDGNRLWLIDWELAFRNDPLVDVAILTTEFAETPDLKDVLLEATLGVKPDRYLRARLEVIRLLTRLFYGCVVLDSLRNTPLASSIPAPSFTPSEFRRAVAERRLASGAPETAYAFARMSLRAFRDGIAAPGFSDALGIAGQG